MRSEKLEELKSYIEELKITQLEKLDNEAKFIKAIPHKCVLNNGKEIYREKLIKGKNNGSAVCILPVLENGNILLTIEPRVFTKKTVGIGLPSGYIEEGEDWDDAALRELKEETGYVSENLHKLCGFYQDMGCSSAYNISVLATNCKKVGSQKLDQGEFVQYIECSVDEVYDLLDNMNYIEGCNEIITLEKARQYLKMRR